MPRQDSEQLNAIAHAVDGMLPDNYGFILLAFPFTGTGGPEGDICRYVSNARREDAVNAIKEWLIHCGHKDDWIKHHD